MTLDTALKIGGATYGAALMASAFVSNRVTETLRLDRFIFPRASEKTRPVNLVLGLIVAGYYVYSLISG